MNHIKPDRAIKKRDIRFKIQALSVTETEDGKRTQLMWEKLHRPNSLGKRLERKIRGQDLLSQATPQTQPQRPQSVKIRRYCDHRCRVIYTGYGKTAHHSVIMELLAAVAHLTRPYWDAMANAELHAGCQPIKTTPHPNIDFGRVSRV